MTSFEVIKSIETNRKFCNREIFAKLNKNISETFLAYKRTFLALKHTLKCTFLAFESRFLAIK